MKIITAFKMSVIQMKMLFRPSLTLNLTHGIASSVNKTFRFSDLELNLKHDDKKSKPDPNMLLFGKSFTDHMLEVEWDSTQGWKQPIISPFHDLTLHPGSKVLHYAAELFEGMKAFNSVDGGGVTLFRPEMNIARMLATAERTCMPKFDGNEFLLCLKKLVSIEASWVPKAPGSSLYIRPTFIGIEPTLGVTATNRALLYVIMCPVGPYFPTGFKPVSLLADPRFVRAWPGGCGDKKMGANYASTLHVQQQAEKRGFQQILWLFGKDHHVTEVGTMNIFVHFINENGERELITPPLDGLILPGVTRYSILDLCRELNEFKVTERAITMKELLKLLKEKKLLEIFGAGTACVVCPIHNIHYEATDYAIPTMETESPLYKRLLGMLNDIQYGRVKHKWSVPVDSDETNDVLDKKIKYSKISS